MVESTVKVSSNVSRRNESTSVVVVSSFCMKPSIVTLKDCVAINVASALNVSVVVSLTMESTVNVFGVTFLMNESIVNVSVNVSRR